MTDLISSGPFPPIWRTALVDPSPITGSDRGLLPSRNNYIGPPAVASCHPLASNRALPPFPRHYFSSLPCQWHPGTPPMVLAFETSFFGSFCIPEGYRNRFPACRCLGYPDGSGRPSI